MKESRTTSQMKQSFLDNLANYDGEIRSTCNALGIKESTFYAWTTRDAAFKDQLDKERQHLKESKQEAEKENIQQDITVVDDLYNVKLDSLKEILVTSGIPVNQLAPLIEATARAQAVEEMTYHKVISSGGDKQQTRIYLEAAKVAYNMLDQCGLKLDAKMLQVSPTDDFNRLMILLHYNDDPEIKSIVEEVAERIANQKVQALQDSNSRKSKRLKC